MAAPTGPPTAKPASAPPTAPSTENPPPPPLLGTGTPGRIGPSACRTRKRGRGGCGGWAGGAADPRLKVLRPVLAPCLAAASAGTPSGLLWASVFFSAISVSL